MRRRPAGGSRRAARADARGEIIGVRAARRGEPTPAAFVVTAMPASPAEARVICEGYAGEDQELARRAWSALAHRFPVLIRMDFFENQDGPRRA